MEKCSYKRIISRPFKSSSKYLKYIQCLSLPHKVHIPKYRDKKNINLYMLLSIFFETQQHAQEIFWSGLICLYDCHKFGLFLFAPKNHRASEINKTFRNCDAGWRAFVEESKPFRLMLLLLGELIICVLYALHELKANWLKYKTICAV